jgi:hypothetical protein
MSRDEDGGTVETACFQVLKRPVGGIEGILMHRDGQPV